MRTQHELNKLMALRHIHRTKTCKKRHLVASNLQKEYVEPILRELRNQGLIQVHRNAAHITPFGKAYLKKADGLIPLLPGKKFRIKSKVIKLFKGHLFNGIATALNFCSMLFDKRKAFKISDNTFIKHLSSKLKESL